MKDDADFAGECNLGVVAVAADPEFGTFAGVSTPFYRL
jgi:hypothetical protein